MKKGSTKNILLEHSKVKVDLYSKYLAKYLNILKRANFCEKIFLYDLMCGEGIYSDKSEGSPIVALKTIKEHYFSNNRSCIEMDVKFNDNALSDVEKGRYKIDRVEEFSQNIFKPDNVLVSYTKLDFVSDIYDKLITRIKSLKRNERMLLFLDPHGYKDIKPNHIKEILCNDSIELILFVPITPMYRFANKSIKDDEFSGGESLKQILKTLLKDEDLVFTKESAFIDTLKNRYRSFLSNKYFVDTFTLQRDKSNTYALFFFTPHYKGFETMLKTKWELDDSSGRGFKIRDKNQLDFFNDDVEYSTYPKLLEDYIKIGNGKINNKDLYLFGLQNGFLPSHTKKVFDEWRTTKPKFKVLDNGKPARAFYLGSDYYSGKKENLVNFVIE